MTDSEPLGAAHRQRPKALLARAFGQALTAVLAALMAIGGVHYLSVRHAERVATETRQLADLEVARATLASDLGAVVTDLRLLARHIEQMVPNPESTAGSAELARIFLVFAEQKRLYDQIRFIGADGRETLRVNLAYGRARLVPGEELQDKSGRYYFAETLALDPRHSMSHPSTSTWSVESSSGPSSR